jgi:hypothetical protein
LIVSGDAVNWHQRLRALIAPFVADREDGKAVAELS